MQPSGAADGSPSSTVSQAPGRGHGKAIIASARKLAVLFWSMLARGEDYATTTVADRQEAPQARTQGRPPRHTKAAAGVFSVNRAMRAEKQLAEQAEVSYKRMVQDEAGAPAKKVGASATPERA
jgi:hypothetical protein